MASPFGPPCQSTLTTPPERLAGTPVTTTSPKACKPSAPDTVEFTVTLPFRLTTSVSVALKPTATATELLVKVLPALRLTVEAPPDTGAIRSPAEPKPFSLAEKLLNVDVPMSTSAPSLACTP